MTIYMLNLTDLEKEYSNKRAHPFILYFFGNILFLAYLCNYKTSLLQYNVYQLSCIMHVMFSPSLDQSCMMLSQVSINHTLVFVITALYRESCLVVQFLTKNTTTTNESHS